jgi:SAM-dependent MidA family methyltransferase
MGSLTNKIQDQITQAGGWIGFDVFMNLALYAPGQGYYCGGGEPFGESGDFETAPMIGPWLSQTIWHWSQAMRNGSDLRVREFGGGRGDLAHGLMQAAVRQGCSLSLEMIELSAGLQALQRERLAMFESVAWRSELQTGFSGLVIANELLDAMPVKCFEWQGGDQVLEWGVGFEGPRQSTASFQWISRPAAESLRQHVARRAQAAADRGLPWAIGYRGEACLWTAPWLRSLSDSMESGAVLLIDYGFCESELDQPGRTSGTLCAHFRHQRIDSSDALLQRAGEQDLTAHVNFSAIAFQAQQAGFMVDGFVTQARYLMNAGVLNLAQEALVRAGTERERIGISQSLQKLLTESEMGEVFKVMLLTKGLTSEIRNALYSQGFAGGDRLASL